jgi:hypothetical protein
MAQEFAGTGPALRGALWSGRFMTRLVRPQVSAWWVTLQTNSLRTGKIHHFIAGKTHYFYGHFPVRYVKLPEGNLICPDMMTLVSLFSTGLWIHLSKASTPVEEADEKRKIRPEDPAVVAYGPGAVETGRDVGEEDGQTDAAWLQLFYLFSSLLFCLGGLDFLTCA